MHVFLFKEKTAYEMRISDWSSDVCSSDLRRRGPQPRVQDDLLRLCRLRHRRRYRPALRTGGHCTHRGAALLIILPEQCRLRNRKSVVKDKRLSVRVELVGSRIIKKKKTTDTQNGVITNPDLTKNTT